MKRTFTTLFILSLALPALAQKAFILKYQEKKGFISVGSGVSLPVGRFGSQSCFDPKAGFAKPGLAINVAAGFKLAGPVGIMARYEQHQNEMHTDPLLQGMARFDNSAWTAMAGKWSLGSVLVGPFISLPVGRFSVDARFLTGKALALCPETQMHGNMGTIPMSVITGQGKAKTTAYLGGMTVRYRLGRSLALQVNADYTNAYFEFRDMKTVSKTGGQEQMVRFNSDRPINTLNVSGGLTFLFGNRNRPF